MGYLTSAVKNGGLVEASMLSLNTSVLRPTSAVKNGGLVEAAAISSGITWRATRPPP